MGLVKIFRTVRFYFKLVVSAVTLYQFLYQPHQSLFKRTICWIKEKWDVFSWKMEKHEVVTTSHVLSNKCKSNRFVVMYHQVSDFMKDKLPYIKWSTLTQWHPQKIVKNKKFLKSWKTTN